MAGNFKFRNSGSGGFNGPRRDRGGGGGIGGSGNGHGGGGRGGGLGGGGGRGGGRDGGPPRKPNFPMGYKKLEEILTNDPDEVILRLNQGSGFQLLLETSDIRRDMMVLIIQAVAKACDTGRLRNSLMSLLAITLKSAFFTKQLPTFILGIKDIPIWDRNNERDRFRNVLLECLIKIFRSMLDIYPTTACDDIMLVMYVSQEVVDYLSSSAFIVNSTLVQELGDLEIRRKELCEQNLAKSQRGRRQITEAEAMSNEEPPNSFREVSVMPTVEDIHTQYFPFVRPNIVHGKYKSAEHYLDVQFRLLREDFTTPLREGIGEYLAQKKNNLKTTRYQDIRIYENVHILHSMCLHQGIAYKIQFDLSKLRNVRWEATKRLIYGSLLCLSQDNFSTVYFATVVNRNPLELQEGLLDVRFENVRVIRNIQPGDTFVMAEAQAYFEAYRHILEGLQDIRETTLPLKRYLVDVSRDVNLPSYIHPETRYDLRPLLMDEKIKKKNTESPKTFFDSDSDSDTEFSSDVNLALVKNIPPAKRQYWPTAEECHLDPSQMQAIQSALTREMAVVQGPPGTGKTYIGLKIVETLLHNRKVWADARSRPILIVCFTNHALDQFLEGISKFTSKLIRIGGRSTSEQLAKFNLKNVRAAQRKARKLPPQIFYNWKEIVSNMHTCQAMISAVGKKVASTLKGIVHESYLCEVMTSDQEQSLKNDYQWETGFYLRHVRSYIMEWLCLTPGAQFGKEDLAYLQGNEEEENAAEIEMEMGEENGNDIEAEESEEEEELEIAEQAELEMSNRYLDEDLLDLLEAEAPAENILAYNLNDEDIVDASEEAKRDQWQLYGSRRIQKRLLKRELKKGDVMLEEVAERVTNVWTLSLKHRWRLYRYWLSKYRIELNKKVAYSEDIYEREASRLQEMRREEDLTILAKAKVVGLTTTGTARLRTYLQALQPSIVIVEEAAEVLEAHIVTALSQHCKHLILIGDHKQLRPNPTVYKLAKEYNLDISLFERLINNGLEFDQLELQHRMRPEIADLLVPNIYPSLQNHSSVLNYGNVRGIANNLFFINHDVPETSVADTQSKANIYEVRYLVELCRYFRQQGYDAEKITILTMYLGQLFSFKKHMRKKIFHGVRVTAVDNFQGEENDIILLSLVRSNIEGNIGFLKVANRVCVALSRAKIGLYVIGNFQLLAQKEKLWQTIVGKLERTKSIGPALTSVCENHPTIMTVLQTPEDFSKVREGGCNLPCEYRLNCGHQCASVCHVTDKEHEQSICQKPCSRTCPNGHRCRLKCGVQCPPCGHLVQIIISGCSHVNLKPCGTDPDTATCDNPCLKTLPCSHKCSKKCSELCAVKCNEPINKKGPCGHTLTLPCSSATIMTDWKLAIECEQKCDGTLNCGHKCRGTCGRCRQGKLHEPCRERCQRVLICGHPCTEPCAENCPPCTRQCENRCVHTKCPEKCDYPCVSCKEQCSWQCPHQKCTNLCSELCSREPCDEPCPKRLKCCGEKCIGLCGEPCPKKCRRCNHEEVTAILFGNEDEEDARFVELEDCGHIVEVGGMDRWMKEEKKEEKKEIIMKECPHCKTIIRRNLRYGNEIRSILNKVVAIKAKIFGQREEIETKAEDLLRKLISRYSDIADWFYESCQTIGQRLLKKLSYSELNVLENQILCFDKLAKLKGQMAKLPKDTDHQFLENEIKFLDKWLMKHCLKFSDQELKEVTLELQRLSLLNNLRQCVYKDGTARTLTDLAKAKYDLAHDALMALKPFRETQELEVKKLIEEVSQLQGGLGISEVERVMIVEALNFRQGHWYQCRNGHFYVVGDCGNPTQEGRCPTCQSRIGGRDAYLIEDNQRADHVMLNARR